MVKHFFFDIFGKEIRVMKNYLLFGILCLALLVSCGEDNDDIVLPEDVSNIDFAIGVRFGRVIIGCTSNCVTVYNVSDKGVFSADTSLVTTDAPNNFTFFDCPISEETRFISQIDDLREVPRGLRDIPSTNLIETISNSNFPEIYTIEYTLRSGAIKTIQFPNGTHDNEQISDYYSAIIRSINELDRLDTTPIDNCNSSSL